MNKKPKKRKPKKRGGSALKLIIFVMVIIVLVVIAMICISALSYRPSIIKDDVVPFETLSYDEEEEPDSEDEVNKPTKTSTGKYIRSDDDFYTFLLLGKDSVAMNTDVIMLASFNVTKDEIAVMQIPRDTYIELYGSAIKINSMYAALYMKASRDGEEDPVTAAMQEFVDVLQKNLNVKIDYHALLYLEGFSNIIDAIGGVEIDVPYDMYYVDPYQDLYIDLKAGLTTLNGNQAEQFVRFRNNYIEGDIGRVNAQKLFITALLSQIKKGMTITKIPKIASELINNLHSKIPLNDIIYFGKEALNSNLSNTVMFTLPGTDARADGDSGAWYYIMHRADTLNLINRYFNVYTVEITDSIFDINQVFNAENRSHINYIYRSPAKDDINSLIYTADEINENGINIPLLRR